MDLTEFYKRLGTLINIREKIRKDIVAIQKDSGGRSLSRIESLENEYESVQQQIIDLDRQIRKYESAGVSL